MNLLYTSFKDNPVVDSSVIFNPIQPQQLTTFPPSCECDLVFYIAFVKIAARGVHVYHIMKIYSPLLLYAYSVIVFVMQLKTLKGSRCSHMIIRA